MALPVYISPRADDHPAASALAGRLALAPLPSARTTAGLVLDYRDDRLQIRSLARRETPWCVDFGSARSNFRRNYGGGVGQTLARAVGVKGAVRPTVLDATAGWGRDAFVLASLGCQVVMLERHPIVAELLADGLRRAAADPALAAIASRMSLHGSEATAYLRNVSTEHAPDTVYLDPMYPPSRSTAAVKKDLRLLRELLDGATDDPRLLTLALACARKRVVVKRPKSAPPLARRPTDAQLASSNTRYDVYFA